MESRSAPKWSPIRLAIALAIQAALAVLDIVIPGSTLTITGSVLLVPLVLAVIGQEREVAITGVVAIAVAVGSTWWNDATGTGQTIYRIGFYTAFAALAVVAARARERATALADTNENLAIELRGTQARLDGILGSLGEAVTVHDERGKTVYVNDAAVTLLGSENVDDVLAAEPGELAQRFHITREDGTPVRLEDLPGRRLVAGEDEASLLTRSVRRDTGEATWLLTKATLYTDPEGRRLAINIIEDVTEAKDAELRQRFLAEAGQVLATSLDYEQTLAARGAHDRPRARGLVRDRDGRRARRVAPGRGRPRRPGKVQMAHDLRRRYPPDPDGPTGVPAILRGGPAELYTEIPAELIERAAQDEEHLRLIRELGMRSAMAVPMRIGDADARRRHARLGRERPPLRRGRPRLRRGPRAARRHGGAERAPVRGAGARGAHSAGEPAAGAPPGAAGLGDERRLPGRRARRRRGRRLLRHPAGRRRPHGHARRRDRQGRRGGRPDLAGAPFGPHRRPLRPAARARPLARQRGAAPAAATVAGDRRVRARLDDGDRATVTVASAGHPLPLRRPSDQAPAPLGDHGVLLGVEGQDEWTETVAQLTPGETLLFYTDGVTETPGERGRFGDARLRDAMARARETPEELLTEIDDALREFQAGVTLDDRAMLVLRFVGARRQNNAAVTAVR